MKKTILLTVIILIISISFVSAKDITFSLNQTEYYFLTGQNALIILETENTYSKQINGILTYTITQEINQGGVHYTNSNTESKTLSINDGNDKLNFNFGTSNNPLTLKINLDFQYNEKEKMIVKLENILIHFVSDQEQQQNNQESKQCTSEKVEEEQTQKEKQEQEKPQLSQQQQTLQNNQMAQDSSAVKKQLEKQLQEQQQEKEEFKKELEKNEKFQEMDQELQEQGYTPKDSELNPTGNNSGDFKITYQNKNNEEATIEGKIENGTIKEINKQSAEDRKDMLNQLYNNTKFQKFNQTLNKEDFSQKNMNFSFQNNKTILKIDYINQNNETASIKTEFINNTVNKIELYKKENTSKKIIWFLFLILAVITYYLYKKRYKKEEITDIKSKKTEKPFDYLRKSKNILKLSKELFDKKQYKDAYGKAAQALRLFLAYKNDLKKELTNYEIIEYLKKNKIEYKNIKQCFDLCSLVEFAKYKANKKDFDKIIKLAENTINIK